MTENEYTKQAKTAALEHGADLVGVVNVADLPEHSQRIERMLPGAQKCRPQYRFFTSGNSLNIFDEV